MFDLGTLLHPGDFDPNVLPGVRNPLGAPPELADALDLIVTVGNTIVVTAVLLAGASLVIRYRRADPVEAAQIRWIAVVGITATVLLGFSAFQLGPITDLAFDLGLVALACLPIAIGIAITRYRLYDIDRLINRTLVYGSLTAILAGVFTAAVGGAQRIFIAMTGETSDGAIVATTLVVATLYAPLRKRLEAIVDRRFKYEQSTFGSYRDELLRTISLIDADAAAQRLAREVARETGALGVAVLGRSGEPSASSGLWPVEGAVELEIEGGHGEIARLVVGPRPGGVVVEPARLAAAQSLAALAARAIREADAR
jgi:hypothetical protein